MDRESKVKLMYSTPKNLKLKFAGSTDPSGRKVSPENLKILNTEISKER